MSKQHQVKILETTYISEEVRCFVVEKPDGYQFTPGQATSVAIAKDGWRDEDRPFSFTSLNQDPTLEFIIKIYPERDGVTDRLTELEVGDELLVEDPWGAIEYQGEGVFIAGGAGLTPFIAILRDLHAQGKLGNNRLIYSDSSRDHLILNCELKRMLGDNCLFSLTEKSHPQYPDTQIDKKFLQSHIKSKDQYFYLCGPPEMMDDITEDLKSLGIADDKIITEDLD